MVSIVLLYGYYRVCKWLTYGFFMEPPEKIGVFFDDYVVVYGRKTLGVLLLLPFALFLIAAFVLALLLSNRSVGAGVGGLRRSRGADGEFRIQYRQRGTWIDGPGSNDERVAESMFDSFLENDPRGGSRCRLVRKVNGRVEQVLSSN